MNNILLLALVLFGCLNSYSQTVHNTLTYTQITRLTESHVGGQDWQHVLSDNGDKVVWFKQTNDKQVFVANADGSGMNSIVDLGSDRLTQVDISADGTKVVYVGGPFAAGHTANFINTDGSGYVQLFALNELRMHTLKISGDGTKAFFNIYTDANLPNGGGPIERGVYSVNLDGTGLTQVAGPADVATALGVSASDIGSFYGGSSGPSIDVSHDGSELVFVARNDVNNRHYVFTTSGGITEAFGPFQWLNGVGISSDGSTIAASVNDSGNNEGWVSTYDGTNPQMIASNDDMFYFCDGNSRGDAVSLTSDGSKVMFDGHGAYLFNTDGSGVYPLMAGTAAPASFPMILDIAQRITLSSDGSRALFSFTEQSTGGLWQLAILDVNPPSLGVCPALSEMTMDPAGAVPDGQSSAMSLKVTPALGTDSIDYAGNVALLDNRKDGNIYASTFYDNGSSAGDQIAGDGVYTHNNIYAYTNAVLGPRTMRFNAEVYSDDLKLRGTAVDVTPFTVVADIGHLGINDHARLNFGIYPNPSSNMVYIDIPGTQFNGCTLEVYDQLGRKMEVYPFVMNQQPMLNTSGWADGVYTVKMIAKSGAFGAKRMIKN